MAKISELDPVEEPTGDETVVVLAEGEAKRALLGGIVAAVFAPINAAALAAINAAVGKAQAWASQEEGEVDPTHPGLLSALQYAEQAAADRASLGSILWDTAQYLFGILDPRGFARVLIDRDGAAWFHALSATSFETETLRAKLLSSGEDVFTIVDERGYRAVDLTPELMRLPPAKVDALTVGEAPLRKVEPVPIDWGSEVELVLTGGQSLSRGFTNNALVTRDPPNALMLSTGQWFTNGDSTRLDFDTATLVPYAGTMFQWGGFSEAPPPTLGMIQAINESIEADTGLSPTQHGKRFIGLNVGLSGASLLHLSKGYAPFGSIPAWQEMLDAVTRIKALCDAAGLHLTCRRFGWVQGESNTEYAPAAYEALLRTYVADLQTDLKPILNQSEAIHLISYQTAGQNAYVSRTFGPALGQLQAALADPLIHIGANINNLSHHDGVHVRPEATLALGGMLGRSSYRIIERGEAVEPLRAVSRKIIGKRCVLTFAGGVGPIRLVNVLDAVNFGISVRSADGNTLIPITTPVRVSGNAVAFETANAEDFPADAAVWVGRDPETALNGMRGGPRIGVMDSAGFYAPRFDPNGLNLALHTVCAISKVTT
ncbi:MAG: hypothetical protein CVT77_09435 [Alphaproteobacteria bacterium HGW-Alphaproteobacteria-16]|nr:MAG: hypothetical protein CVT77_09435 [Alphaproteobacteria bacterium HGW-Alphaproteobacteria-16]